MYRGLYILEGVKETPFAVLYLSTPSMFGVGLLSYLGVCIT